MTIKDKLISCVTQYDQRESKKPGHNPYALGIYFQRIDEIVADIEAGDSPRAAICAGLNGRLADRCLKAIVETASTAKELNAGPWFYQPVVKTHNETCTEGQTFDGEASFADERI